MRVTGRDWSERGELAKPRPSDDRRSGATPRRPPYTNWEEPNDCLPHLLSLTDRRRRTAAAGVPVCAALSPRRRCPEIDPDSPLFSEIPSRRIRLRIQELRRRRRA
jgi:hypothetical protein